MKIFNWVHRKFHYKDGIGGNENKNAKDTDKHILLEDIVLSDVLHGWKEGVLTIGTFGFDPIKVKEKEYLYQDEEEENENDVTNESEDDNDDDDDDKDDDEEQEANPLINAAYSHEFKISTSDNLSKNVINGVIDHSCCDINNMKKERTTLADLFYADSVDEKKQTKNKNNTIDKGFNKKLPASDANYKRGISFAKKLVPRAGEDSRPIKKLHQMVSRMLKKKIHPDMGVKINKDNHQNGKIQDALEDCKMYESISLLQSQAAVV